MEFSQLSKHQFSWYNYFSSKISIISTIFQYIFDHFIAYYKPLPLQNTKLGTSSTTNFLILVPHVVIAICKSQKTRYISEYIT